MKTNYIIFKKQFIKMHENDLQPLLEVDPIKVKNIKQGYEVDIEIRFKVKSLKSKKQYIKKLK